MLKAHGDLVQIYSTIKRSSFILKIVVRCVGVFMVFVRAKSEMILKSTESDQTWLVFTY